jgi:hypothetical protein
VITARWPRRSCTGSGPGLPGVTCPLTWDRGRRYGSATAASPGTARQTGSTPRCPRTPTVWARSTGTSAWTRRSTEPTSTARTSRATQGELSNHNNLLLEPADHAVGRPRGGLGTKIHHVCDGKGRPLVLLLGPGQANDSPMSPACWMRSEYPAAVRDGLGPVPTRSSRTRPTPPAQPRTASLARHQRGDRQTVRPDQARQAQGIPGGRPPKSTPRRTRVATS